MQVKQGARVVTVDLLNKTCDCRVFQLTGIPCSHAIAAIHDSRQQPIHFVSDYFKRDRYLKSYSQPLEAIKGEEYWELKTTDPLLPPDILKQLRGRPKLSKLAYTCIQLAFKKITNKNCNNFKVA